MPTLSFMRRQPATGNNFAIRSIDISITRTRVTRQPQRINPPRRIRRVLGLVQPTRQLDRIRRQIPSNLRIIVPMAVVMQTTLGIEVLPLKPQRLIELLSSTECKASDLAVGVVLR